MEIAHITQWIERFLPFLDLLPRAIAPRWRQATIDGNDVRAADVGVRAADIGG